MSQPLTLTLARRAPCVSGALGALIFIALLILPFLALLPAAHPLAVSTYTLTLMGKILCYAIVAVALDLVWGYAGLLSLGHGLFFALGGYAMGMYLMRQAAGDGLPAFMSFLSWTELPWFWAGTQHFAWALCLIVLVPGLLALLFGYFAFRSRIKDVYFSIMTQALTYAGMLLFFRNETGFGGNNGFTGFTTILGFPVSATGTRIALFIATVLLLVAALAIGVAITRSKFGPGADRRARCGESPDVLRLRSARIQAVRLDAVSGAVWAGGGAVCAAGGHYQPQRNVAH
jgi:amino acid/amide ABC transporter membrane protein 2, HAAT family (TC 3.A.1.4.-)